MSTKQKIIDSYINLVISEKTADISVMKICESAQISRKSFYYHFRDRYEILEHIFISDIEKHLVKALKYNYSHKDVIKLMFENFLLNRDFYRVAMMETTQNSMFDTIVNRLSVMIADYDRDNDRYNLDKREREYINYRSAVEITYMIKLWMTEGMKESPEFMSRVIVYPREM